MEINYLVADPTGNLTALVESPVPPEARSAAAAAVFSSDKGIEQLGFLSDCADADIALTMAGGEFCGNASLCAGAYCLRGSGRAEGRVTVAVSGAEKPVAVELRRIAENEYSGRVEMPPPLEITSHAGLPLVRFSGISHLILPPSTSRTEAEAMIAPLCKELGAEALGLMVYDREAGSMEPLVYVPGADSLFWECSCASGSCAVAAYEAARQGKSVCLRLRQKGGVLTAEAEEAGGIKSLHMGGRVKLGPSRIQKFAEI